MIYKREKYIEALAKRQGNGRVGVMDFLLDDDVTEPDDNLRLHTILLHNFTTF